MPEAVQNLLDRCHSLLQVYNDNYLDGGYHVSPLSAGEYFI